MVDLSRQRPWLNAPILAVYIRSSTTDLKAEFSLHSTARDTQFLAQELEVPTRRSTTMRAANVLLATTTIGIFLTWQKIAQAHPLCYYDDRPTDKDMVLTFCPAQAEGACCNAEEEAAAKALYTSKGTLTTACAALYKQVCLRYGCLFVGYCFVCFVHRHRMGSVCTVLFLSEVPVRLKVRIREEWSISVSLSVYQCGLSRPRFRSRIGCTQLWEQNWFRASAL